MKTFIVVVLVLVITLVAVFAPQETGMAVAKAYANAKPVAVKAANAINDLAHKFLALLKKAGEKKEFNADEIVKQGGFDRGAKIVQTKWGKLVDSIAPHYGLPPKLIVAKITVESGGKKDTVGALGEIGLLQLMPTTANSFGYSRQNLFNPRKNIECGCQYLAWLKSRRGSDADAIVAFSWGDGRYAEAIRLAGCAENVQCYKLVAAVAKTL